MGYRQSLRPDGTARPLTLIASLRQAFATSLGCDVRQNYTRMWDVLQDERSIFTSEEKALEYAREMGKFMPRSIGV